MRHGNKGLFIFNCDNKKCFFGTGIYEQDQDTANKKAIEMGWTLGVKDICPECHKKARPTEVRRANP